MRRLTFGFVVLTGCVAGAPGPVDEPADEPEPPGPGGGGGLPTRACGAPRLGGEVGCAVWRGLCFGSWGSSQSLSGAGDCTGSGPGAIDASGDIAFASERAGAVQIGGTLELSAIAGDQVIALAFGAEPGTYDCADAFAPRIGYFANGGGAMPAVDFRSWRGIPATCSVTLTAAGAIGERVTGSFSAQLIDWRGGAQTLALTGSFDVERIAY